MIVEEQEEPLETKTDDGNPKELELDNTDLYYEMWDSDQGLRVLTLAQSAAERSVHQFSSWVALDFAANVLALNDLLYPMAVYFVQWPWYRHIQRSTVSQAILKPANSSLFDPGRILQTLR